VKTEEEVGIMPQKHAAPGATGSWQARKDSPLNFLGGGKAALPAP
jgi:hypothetical protein